ncbi:MAG: tetratricopeptide repeat protein [Planctomycetes bacterium]|nr:tetratricopeptide repeat protein [Planctomycetota bacterium]
MRCLTLAFALAACGAGAARELPRLADPAGVDPFVLERVAAALAACERGTSGAELELAKLYDANGLSALALAGYDLCLSKAATGPAAERALLQFLRGQALASLGRTPAALAAFDAALLLGDAYAPTNWRRGELLLDEGRVGEAQAAFEQALALEPLSVPANLGLARVMLLGDDAAGAATRLERLSERDPDERFVHGLLARAYRALGDAARAEVELRREQRASRISLADTRLAEVQTRATGVLAGVSRANELLAAGQASAAVALLEPLFTRAPDDLALLQMFGKSLLQAGDPARAVEVLEAGLARHPEQFKLELFLGQAHAARKANKKALEHLRRARELNPAFGPTWVSLAEVQQKLGHPDEAERSLLAAQEAGEDELRTRLLLVQVQLEQQAFVRALASARAAREAYPNAVAAWTWLAEAEARNGNAEGARAALAEAEARNPEYERLAAVRALLGAGDPAR